jgi:antitoxin VapB
MPLNIRDPRAQKLAKDLARRRGTTMTAVIVEALEKETRAPQKQDALDRIKTLQKAVKSSATPAGRDITKEELDSLWAND